MLFSDVVKKVLGTKPIFEDIRERWPVHAVRITGLVSLGSLILCF